MDYARNITTPRDFYLIAFSNSEDQHIVFFGLLLMYLLTVIENTMIIILVCLVPQLHTPMYFFLCNLAVQDIISVTAFLPKMMAIAITLETNISFPGCITQIFIFAFCTCGDFLLLAIMAYDRYVAICIPLRYHLIMNPQFCILLVTASCILCITNALCYSLLISNFSFCRLFDINHIFCEPVSMIKLSCSDTTYLQIVIMAEIPLIGIFPLGLILTSYAYIIYTILKMRTSAARLKIFSSCSSHLTVVLLFGGTCIILYTKPGSNNSQEVDKILSLFYLAFIPMLNPVVYSLRNRQVQSAAKHIFTKYISHALCKLRVTL